MKLKLYVIKFIVMIIVGVLFNPMNALAFRYKDLYFSNTLFYGGILMACNMIWAHEIIDYLSMGHININVFLIGVVLSVLTVIYLLRNQFMVDDNQWLKRMISHHSTAITTSKNIAIKSKNAEVIKLANEIVDTQEKEITLMKSLITIPV